MSHFNKVKDFVLDLEYKITYEDESEGVLIIAKESEGISNLVLGCAEPLLIMEQYLFDVDSSNNEVFKALLIKNRDIIHGAFVLDETASKVIFRDTLQIENLDRNEIEGSIKSLSLLLSEYSEALINFSKN